MVEIKGYEGLYSVTSCGKVWSHKSQKFLKPSISYNGYEMVKLCKDGQQKNYRVHRLTAEAYIPNPENKPQVNHINEVKTDNYINNLCWATCSENINYGTRNQRAAEKLGRPIYCVELDRSFISVNEAAKQLGIDQSNLNKCLHKQAHTCGDYHWEYYTEDKQNG